MAALLQGHEDIVQLLVQARVQLPLSSTSRSGPLSRQSLLLEFKTLHASELLKKIETWPHTLFREGNVYKHCHGLELRHSHLGKLFLGSLCLR